MPLLRQLLGLSITPLWNNICSSLVTVIYVKLVLETASLMRRRKEELSRKFVHMAAASWIVFWPLFDPTHWSWRLNVVVPTVMAVRLFYKGAIRRNPSELLFGPLQLTLVMIYVGLYQFMKEEACVVMAAVGIGDSLAPLVGHRYGRHFYRMPLGKIKTMEGTMFCFLGTIGGCYLYLNVMGLTVYPLRIILAYSAIAALVEGVAPASMDNLLVPLVIHFSLWRVQQWLPP